MAQQDTGMGWSAEAEWLMSTSGNVARRSYYEDETNFPGQPIPYIDTNPSMQDVANVGMTVGRYKYDTSYEVRVVSGLHNTFVCRESTSDDRCYFLVPGTEDWANGKAYWVAYNPTTGQFYYDYVVVMKLNSYYIRGTDVHYDYTTLMNASTDNRLPIHSVNSALAAIINNAAHSETVDKLNPGYAVACVAKWKTQNGTELVSPILISSDTDFVDMTTTETGHNFAKLNYLLSGVRFYMGFWDFQGSASFTSAFPQIDLTARGNITLDQLFMIIISTDNAHVIIINSPDPYEEEGAGSGEEGGDGEDLEDDEMGISHHAIPAAINTGFCRIYCPSEQQLRDLSNFLWSAQYDLTAVKKLFASPMDSVLGLSAVPLTLSGANMPVYLGGVDTEMSFPMVSYQSYQVPMGAITVEKRWGSYLDYDPYTRFSIFLPFIGFKDLSADDIMGKQIILDYDVDILSGACTARLQAGGNVLYQWSGQCSIQLPVTASNWNQVFQGATSAALSAGLAVATGSAGPVLAGALAAEGAQAIMGKPRIERGGTVSGAAGWMGGLTPYLVRVTPEAIIPGDQNKFIGYPAFSSISLGALTGYNEIASIHLEGIPATGAELEELEAILKGGVIF